MYGISYNKKTICSDRSNLLSEWRERRGMKKRCIWNWDKKKKIEFLDEKRKRSRFSTVLSFWGGIVIEIGIPIIILIVLLLDAIINKHMSFQKAMFLSLIHI